MLREGKLGEGCRNDVGQPGSLCEFSIGFWIIAENNLCGKQTFMILVRWTPPSWFFFTFDAVARSNKQVTLGFKLITPRLLDVCVTSTKLPTCYGILSFGHLTKENFKKPTDFETREPKCSNSFPGFQDSFPQNSPLPKSSCKHKPNPKSQIM